MLFSQFSSNCAGGLSGATSPEDSTVVAYLIDSVTGQILHCVTHPSMQGPVHVVLSLVFVFFGFVSS